MEPFLQESLYRKGENLQINKIPINAVYIIWFFKIWFLANFVHKVVLVYDTECYDVFGVLQWFKRDSFKCSLLIQLSYSRHYEMKPYA